MKTQQYENISIKNFPKFIQLLGRKYEGILGAEWDEPNKTLKIFYEDSATEIPLEELKGLQVPTVLIFRKKLVAPDLGIPNVTPISETEFEVETFDVKTIRKKVREKYPEFEEVSQ